jgi:hypothetical protein
MAENPRAGASHTQDLKPKVAAESHEHITAVAMKYLTRFLLTAALLLPVALSAASTFEGELRMQMTSGKEKPFDIDYFLKGGKARIVPQLGQKGSMAMIMDTTKMEMTMLMPEQKMYMVTSIKSATEEAAKQAGTADVVPERTGRKEKILGYTCEEYLLKSKDGTSSAIWVTDEIGAFAGLGGGGMSGGRGRGPTAQAWENAFAGKNQFPMRVIGLDKKGVENFRMEVTKIEKKSLPDADFLPPAGYQKFEMPPMGDMMKGMMKGLMKGGN